MPTARLFLEPEVRGRTMGETLRFASPEVLASYLYTQCEPYTYSPVQRVYLAMLCSDRAAKLWMKYADGGTERGC